MDAIAQRLAPAGSLARSAPRACRGCRCRGQRQRRSPGIAPSVPRLAPRRRLSPRPTAARRRRRSITGLAGLLGTIYVVDGRGDRHARVQRPVLTPECSRPRLAGLCIRRLPHAPNAVEHGSDSNFQPGDARHRRAGSGNEAVVRENPRPCAKCILPDAISPRIADTFARVATSDRPCQAARTTSARNSPGASSATTGRAPVQPSNTHAPGSPSYRFSARTSSHGNASSYSEPAPRSAWIASGASPSGRTQRNARSRRAPPSRGRTQQGCPRRVRRRLSRHRVRARAISHSARSRMEDVDAATATSVHGAIALIGAASRLPCRSRAVELPLVAGSGGAASPASRSSCGGPQGRRSAHGVEILSP